MELWEVTFLLQFIAVIYIAVQKLLNMMEEARRYEVRHLIILSVGALFLWGIGFTIFLTTVSETTQYLIPLMRMETFLTVLNVILFTIIEVMLYAKKGASDIRPGNRYYSIMPGKSGNRR